MTPATNSPYDWLQPSEATIRNMNSSISQLDDRTALDVLRAIVQHGFARGSPEHFLDSAVIDTLGTQVGAEPISEQVKDGDIARGALQLLAREDPEMQQRIEVLARTRNEKFLDPVTGGVLLTTAVAFVLQTKIKLHYDQSGWKFDLLKPTVSLKEFKDLVSKLMSWWPRQ
jgi:hypothetical protein